jgi:hypothetical protein
MTLLMTLLDAVMTLLAVLLLLLRRRVSFRRAHGARGVERGRDVDEDVPPRGLP